MTIEHIHNDDMQDLFGDAFEDFEADVTPSSWNNISATIADDKDKFGAAVADKFEGFETDVNPNLWARIERELRPETKFRPIWISIGAAAASFALLASVFLTDTEVVKTEQVVSVPSLFPSSEASTPSSNASETEALIQPIENSITREKKSINKVSTPKYSPEPIKIEKSLNKAFGNQTEALTASINQVKQNNIDNGTSAIDALSDHAERNSPITNLTSNVFDEANNGQEIAEIISGRNDNAIELYGGEDIAAMRILPGFPIAREPNTPNFLSELPDIIVEEGFSEDPAQRWALLADMQTRNGGDSQLGYANTAATQNSSEMMDGGKLAFDAPVTPNENLIQSTTVVPAGFSPNADGQNDMLESFAGDFVELNKIGSAEINDIIYSAPLTFNLTFQKPLTKRLSLESGVSFSKLTAKSVFTFNRHSDSEGKIISHLYYIGVPLYIDYTFLQTKKFNLYTNQGILTEKGLGVGYSIDDYYNQGIYIERKTPGLQMAWLQGFGIDYNLGPLTSLYIQGGVSYYFKRDKKQWFNMYTENPLRTNIQVGLRLKL